MGEHGDLWCEEEEVPVRLVGQHEPDKSNVVGMVGQRRTWRWVQR